MLSYFIFIFSGNEIFDNVVKTSSAIVCNLVKAIDFASRLVGHSALIRGHWQALYRYSRLPIIPCMHYLISNVEGEAPGYVVVA